MENPIITTSYCDILQLSESVSTLRKDILATLPYQINLVDLIKANENAHSRILMGLLSQKNGQDYEILDSLLKYISRKYDKPILKTSKPEITSEFRRIDVWVRDKNNFALIIENKICDAKDQNKQIFRYILKTKKAGYKLKDIYVLYLTREVRHDPNDDSFNDCKKLLEGRYVNLTYKDDILPWLKECVQPNINTKDIFLKDCIEQYIDHLEGMFSIRKNQNIMNQEIEKEISSHLKLEGSAENKYQKVSETIKELDTLRNSLCYLQKSMYDELMIEWMEKMKNDFKNTKIIAHLNEDEYPKIGIQTEWENCSFCILIERYKPTDAIYFGIGRHFSSETLTEKLRQVFTEKHILDDFKNTNDWWYGVKNTSYSEAYYDFCDLVLDIQQELKV